MKIILDEDCTVKYFKINIIHAVYFKLYHNYKIVYYK